MSKFGFVPKFGNRYDITSFETAFGKRGYFSVFSRAKRLFFSVRAIDIRLPRFRIIIKFDVTDLLWGGIHVVEDSECVEF